MSIKLSKVFLGLALLFGIIWAWLRLGGGITSEITPVKPVAPFRHVVIIMMENHGTSELLNNPNTPYISHLIAAYGFDPQYRGVTHPSLPNYLATISGSTQGIWTDNPGRKFSGPTIISQLQDHHLTWEGVMQSIPSPTFEGNWYPEPSDKAQSSSAPATALYAKKHNPFAFFTSIPRSLLRTHIVNLHAFQRQLAQGHLADFVWITPNLCHDMHGEPNTSGSRCPVANSAQLERLGNKFLEQLVPEITHSRMWHGNSVMFITWDEANAPAGLVSLPQYLAAAPGAPNFLGVTIGGGLVPLIVIAPQTRHRTISIDCNHYCLLKTIENSWHLKYLGKAANPSVPTLVPLVPKRRVP